MGKDILDKITEEMKEKLDDAMFDFLIANGYPEAESLKLNKSDITLAKQIRKEIKKRKQRLTYSTQFDDEKRALLVVIELWNGDELKGDCVARQGVKFVFEQG